MKKNNNGALRAFFIYKLTRVYGMQKYLDGTLPYMIEAAITAEVKSALVSHQELSAKQISRLQAIFDHLLLKPHSIPTPIVRKMVKEAKTQIRRAPINPVIRDTGILMAWRGIDHYIIATYAGLLGLASSLKFHKVSQSLYLAMEEQMEIDTRLSKVSGKFIYANPIQLKD